MVKARYEAEYAIKVTSEDPYNESPLRYLVALVREQYKTLKQNKVGDNDTGANKDDGNSEIENEQLFLSFLNHVEGEIEKVKESLQCGNDCPSLISAYIDVLEIKGDSSSLEKAAEMANDLALEFDVIRKKYWYMREEKMRSVL